MNTKIFDYINTIRDYSKKEYKNMVRCASGSLKYPFIVPGSLSYSNQLWDWDSWLTDIAVRQIMYDNCDFDPNFYECEKGCVLNFVINMFPDGVIPIVMDPSYRPEMFNKNGNMHKPCLASHAAFIIQNSNGDALWIKPYINKIKLFVSNYMLRCRDKKSGLYFWLSDNGIGVDNDPCTFYRPNKSSASVYLNCLMYKELEALIYICDILGEDCAEYIAEKENLKKSIQNNLWDERNGFFYSADINFRPVDPNVKLHSGDPISWSCLVQKVDVWSGIMVLWAKIATKEQAKRAVRENICRRDIFWANYGIRSLSPLEPMYKIAKTGNPSCWLGPVWGIQNWICFEALIRYGFYDEAKELAVNTITLFGKDIQKNGCMHEYYHPNTGEGVNNPGFLNWNLLVNNMAAYIEGKKRFTEFEN